MPGGLPLRPPTGGGIGGNVIIPGTGGGGGGGGTVILKPPGSFAAGGSVGRNTLVGRTGNKQMPFMRRRKFSDQVTPAMQTGKSYDPYARNPYADIQHYQDYTPSFLLGQPHIAAQQHLMSADDPWAGYPSHDQVQRMSNAITFFGGGRSINAPRWQGGQGLDLGDTPDMLKRLLRERGGY